MQWTDQIRRIKIVLVVAAVLIAVASLLISHFLVRDLSKEEHNRMEVWAQALHALNAADETTDLSLVLSVMEGNNTIPVIVMNDEGEITDYRNIEDTARIESYARRMIHAGDTIRVDGQLVSCLFGKPHPYLVLFSTFRGQQGKDGHDHKHKHDAQLDIRPRRQTFQHNRLVVAH